MSHVNTTFLCQVSQCDECLLHIKVPDIVSRVPRSLVDIAHWKGGVYNCHVYMHVVCVKQCL